MSPKNRHLRKGTALVAGALALAVAAPSAAQAQVPRPRRRSARPRTGGWSPSRSRTRSTRPRARSPAWPPATRSSALTSGRYNGALYAVTKGAGNAGRVYTINPATGRATLAFALVAPGRTTAGGAATPIALSGTQFGVDFNPAADALRIVSNTGQNLRALPSDRVAAMVQRFAGDTFTDGALSYSPIAASPRPVETGVNSAAYTNNDTDPTTATALYDIDAATQRDLVLQNPPNDGTLAKVADLDLGTRQVQGFDIRGATDAFAVLGGLRLPAFIEAILIDRGIELPAGIPVRLASVNLTTGALDERGFVGTSSPLVGFTIDIPAPAAG